MTPSGVSLGGSVFGGTVGLLGSVMTWVSFCERSRRRGRHDSSTSARRPPAGSLGHAPILPVDDCPRRVHTPSDRGRRSQALLPHRHGAMCYPARPYRRQPPKPEISSATRRVRRTSRTCSSAARRVRAYVPNVKPLPCRRALRSREVTPHPLPALPGAERAPPPPRQLPRRSITDGAPFS
jgi:hypothetical protein